MPIIGHFACFHEREMSMNDSIRRDKAAVVPTREQEIALLSRMLVKATRKHKRVAKQHEFLQNQMKYCLEKLSDLLFVR